MPLYEYECQTCHQRFERIQRVSAPPVRECPGCGGEVRRLLGVPALQFKGSGWYVTDYGKGGGNGAGPSKDKNAAATPADNGSSSKATGESGASSSSKGSSASDTSSGSDKKQSTEKAAAAG